MPIANTPSFSKLAGAFGSSFSIKQLPLRRPTALSSINSYGDMFKVEMSGEILNPTFRIGGSEWTFTDGLWEAADVGDVRRRADESSPTVDYNHGNNGISNSTLSRSTNTAGKTQLDTLRDENNLLILKNEALLDMLTEVVAEMHLQESDNGHRN